MDSPNPEAPSTPIGAVFGMRIYRFRTLLRRHWWILALAIGLGVSYQAYVALNKPRVFRMGSRVSRLGLSGALLTAS